MTTVDNKAIAAAFNQRAARYRDSDWHRQSAQRLVELTPVREGDRVLDAGTGTGFAALAAAHRVGPSGSVVGVDLSPAMLDAARAAAREAGASHVEFVEADATALAAWPAGGFDVVISATSLLYMDAAAALREWHRLLRPRGAIGFSTMKAGFPVGGRIFRECAAESGVELRDPCAPLGSAASCRAALEGAGFAVVEIVEEPVAFSPRDVERGWESNLRSAGHERVRQLPAPELQALERRYAEAIAAAALRSPERLYRSEMLYAAGRRR